MNYVSLMFSSIGVVFAFASNERLNNRIQSFEMTVNVALNNSLNFVDDILMVGMCSFICL